MIVVDASVLVAILLAEPEGPIYKEFLLERPGSQLSPVGYWEAATKLRTARGEAGVAELDVVVSSLRIEIAAATAVTANLASNAERDFGKRTSAKLNMGDCFAYALAKGLNAPLLFKGDDFTQTDIAAALPA